MTRSTHRLSDADRVADIRRRFPSWSPARILSGLGHPGYGEVFAAATLELIEQDGFDAFAAKSRVFNEMGIR